MGIIAEKLEAQKGLRRGQEGYWEIFGVRADEIRPGDLVAVTWSDMPEVQEYEIAEQIVRGDIRDLCAKRFRATDGTEFSLGMLASNFRVLRWGTHHVLSETL